MVMLPNSFCHPKNWRIGDEEGKHKKVNMLKLNTHCKASNGDLFMSALDKVHEPFTSLVRKETHSLFMVVSLNSITLSMSA